MRIIFIGGGNMAEAIFSRLEDHDVLVIQRNLQKIERLKKQYPKINFQTKLDFITNRDDLIFLAIKPQDAKIACQGIKQYIKNSTIVSVMAGINCGMLSRWLDNNNICRTMPNTPAMHGFGVTAVYFSQAIISHQFILDIFTKLGKVYKFDDENKIDQMTAVSSSSIAYIFYYIEALTKAAVEQFEFNPQLAKDITLQVVHGALSMIENNPDITIEQLRQNVTSKKGTTEQAIKVLEQYNLHKIISEAELACYDRAKELSILLAKDQ